MKSSRAKSFRLHHINKTSSLRKTSQSFIDPDSTFKLAALNSVTKGVKMADLSMMTGRDLYKLRNQPLVGKDQGQTSAHCSLMDVRVRYDEMKKKSMQAEYHISKQKEQINKLNIFKGQYEVNNYKAKGKVGGMQNRLTDIKSMLEDVSTELKMLQSMKSRHQADKIVYDQRKFDLQQILIHKKKQLKIYQQEGTSEHEAEDRTAKIYQKLHNQLVEEQLQRERHISSLEAMIEQKLSLINANSHREAELAEIASRAIQDKMQTEKHWRMVYLTHVFVNRLLRDKIDSEMKKFNTVELAFKTIKTATGVSDPNQLVNKYLNKESVYGQYLGKIADNERIISDLKAQAEKLRQETKTLEDEKQVLQSTKIKQQDLHDDVKQFMLQDEKATIAYSLHKKISQWLQRQFKKMASLDGNNQAMPDTFTEAMKQFLTSISAVVDTAEEETLPKQITGPAHAEKNMRVIPKRSRKNSMGEEIFDVDEEDVGPVATHEQSDYVNAQHDSLIQSNDKFMREARKKAQQQRKILLEKQQAKSKSPSKAPEPKKQQD